MIVIGLGTGRSGTASLAHLLNSQADALCFHEMNPSCVRFSGTPRPILNTIDEFQAILDGGVTSALTVDLSRKVAAGAYDRLCTMGQVRLIGDIALYYLTYVEVIARHNTNVRFVCLRRDKHATIESWLRKSAIPRWRSKHIAARIASLITREPFHDSRNFWMEHDGTRWRKDDVWDKCFPKFDAPDMRTAIEAYWDYYYEEAERLQKQMSNRFRIVNTTDLSDDGFQSDLLTFCGVPRAGQVSIPAHIHKSSSD